MKKLVLLIALLLLPIGVSFAQGKVATGVVYSAEDNQPIIGASVRVKEVKAGSLTDAQGHFRINLPSGAKTLVISFAGSITQEVPVGTDLKILLKTDQQQLDDVVVVAYGTAKRQSLVGAQTSVGAKDLAKRPITNVSTALSGVAPGVQALTASGQPGESASIRIRGIGSINASSAPVYVVDGTIYDGAIADIAPSDIQSVSILKDAASTAIYGSSAGNGVILITTKSGSRAEIGKPSFNFTMNQGFTRKGQKFYDKVDAAEFYKLRWSQWYNTHKYEDGYPEDQAGATAGVDVFQSLKYNPFKGIVSVYEPTANGSYQVTKTPTPGSPTFPAIVLPNGEINPEITGIAHPEDYDWEKALFRIGHRQEYTFSGGLNTQKLRSFVSFGYMNEAGYRIQTNFNRFSMRGNLSYDINKWLTVGTNISFVKSHEESPKQLGTFNSNSFSFISEVAPIYPIHKHIENGDYYTDPTTGAKVYDHSDTRPFRKNFNPVEESYLDLSQTDRHSVTNRTFATFNLMEGLKLTTNLGYDFIHQARKIRYNNEMGDQPQGVLDVGSMQYKTITFNQLLNYSKSFGDHNFEALLGHESYSYNYTRLYGRKSNAFLKKFDEFANYTEIKGLETTNHNYRKEGYFGRLNYDYQGKYNFSASFRRDGSSRFGTDYRWGNFWAVGAGWNLHKENFLSGTSWIDELKIRTSIGQTGVDDTIDADKNSIYYPYITLYQLNNNNVTEPGLRLQNYGNPKLIWETQTSYDFAVDFALWGKLRGSVELFNKASKDLIFDYPLPLSSGVNSVSKNIGKVRNYGLEFNLDATLLQTRDLRWGLKLNGTIAKNIIVALPDANREDGIELDYHKYMEGKSIYEYYLNVFKGVDPENGKALYILDKKKYPDQTGLSSNPDLTYNSDYAKKDFAGTSIPDLYGGFGTELSFRGIDLAIDFSYQIGGKTLDGSYIGRMRRDLDSGVALHPDIRGAWKKPGDMTNIPALDASPNSYNGSLSDRFLLSSSALMLRSISLGYTLPKSLTDKLHMGTVRISVAGENLALFSAKRGLNPFGQYNGVSEAAGYGYARTLTTSLSINL